MDKVRYRRRTTDGRQDMCELLVRVVDKINPDPYLNVGLTKRGDVIAVCPNGWNWGTAELSNPEWRIICLPNVTETEVASLLQPEVNTDPLNPSKMLQRRAFKLDLDHPTLASEVSGKRNKSKHTLNINFGQVNSMKLAKPPIPDPNIL